MTLATLAPSRSSLDRAAEEPRSVFAATPDDRALADAVGHGDRDALAEVYLRHHAHLRRLATRLCGDAQADDVVQDVVLRLWQRPGAYDPNRGSLRAFLVTMTRSRALDCLRSGQARRTRECLFQESANHRPDVELDDLLGLLQTLAPARRDPIALAYLLGYTYREVAGLLGVPEGTVKSRIRLGLTELREVLTQGQLRVA